MYVCTYTFYAMCIQLCVGRWILWLEFSYKMDEVDRNLEQFKHPDKGILSDVDIVIVYWRLSYKSKRLSLLIYHYKAVFDVKMYFVFTLVRFWIFAKFLWMVK